ncbi:integrin alpha-V-like isoform X2 [Oculina patagonica]
MARTWHVVLALVACFAVVLPFNLDIKDPDVYKGSPGEYFGYAVALHNEKNIAKSKVVVGAPLGNKTAQTDKDFTERERYGSVYKCSTSDPKKECIVITIDDTEPQTEQWTDKQGDPHIVNLEEKSGQWLGATLISATSENTYGKLLACAPRYTVSGSVRAGETPEHRRPFVVGKCFLVMNSLGYVSSPTLQPCFHGIRGSSGDYLENKDGVCQAGLSAAMSKDGMTVLLGSPGRFAMNGSVEFFEFVSDRNPESARSSKRQVLDGSKTGGNLIGYAVAMGNFKYPDRQELIASSPRAENLKGKVLAFDVDYDNYLLSVSTLPRPSNVQMGSNFGQSLCAVDLNNDGYSDLLVSAPYHHHSKNGDEGRVYVYMNNGQSPGTLNHVESMNLDGRKTKSSLFGYAMAIAGDLNRDGFLDVAISAPYGGKDQGGVVFLYFGTKDGIETSFRQAIEASDVSAGVKTFGFSLAGNLDVDNNGYPDLAVGAYSSDRAFLLRARPIVEMYGEIKLSPTQISLEDNQTNMRLASDGVMRKSIEVTVCLKYKNQMPSLGMPNVTFSVNLDQERFTDGRDLRRMFFFYQNKPTFSMNGQMSLTKENEWHCQLFDTAYLREKEQLQNMFEDLTFNLTYDLKNSAPCTLCPILNDYNDISKRSFRAQAEFVKLCRNNEVCKPDLSIRGEVRVGEGKKSEILLGKVKEITVRVMVENKALDAAYPGKVILTYPSVIDYASSKEISCSTAAADSDSRKAECLVGNPFRGNMKRQFDIIFNTQRVTGNITEFTIDLEASSGLTKDADPSNNKQALPVAVKFEADLGIVGFSNPDQVVYSDKVTEQIKTAYDIGPAVKQTITVRNNGPSPVEYAEVSIMVPFKYNKQEDPNYLLYLMEVQVIGNAGSCNVKTNPLDLQLNANSSQESNSSTDKSRREVNQSSVELPCETNSDMTCLKFPCFLGRMMRGDLVNIQIKSRLWQNTLIEANVGSLNITTTAKVVAPSSVSEPDEKNNEVKIGLKANPRTTPKGKSGKVAAWIIIVSVLGGLLLIGLAVFALYKFGFFKRNRHEDHKKDEPTEEEMTPMNTSANQA